LYPKMFTVTLVDASGLAEYAFVGFLIAKLFLALSLDFHVVVFP